MLRCISWNVNGFRAALKNGFAEKFAALDADIFCIQETKMQPSQAVFAPEGYEQYWFSAQKAGYSGTAVFTRRKPLSVAYGVNGAHMDEGRTITLDYGDFYLVNNYTPNAQRELTRLPYRMQFEDDMRAYLCSLRAQKPVLFCGDLNVAHEEIDIKNAKSNIGNAGFTYEERGKFTELLQSGFLDSFRTLYPDKTDAYTWWSYMFHARERNTGWRIDYFVISDSARDKLLDATIHPDITGSDHCPVGVTMDF